MFFNKLTERKSARLKLRTFYTFAIIFGSFLFYLNLQMIFQLNWNSPPQHVPVNVGDSRDDLDLVTKADRLRVKINEATIPARILTNNINNGKNSIWTTYKDNFTDLIQYLKRPRNENATEPFEFVIHHMELDSDNPTMGEVLNETLPANATIFEKFQMAIFKQELYKKNDPMIPELLHALATEPYDEIGDLRHGTQLKFIMYFDKGGKAMAKPRRYPRTQDTLPNHEYFSDFERHTSEIATFHLDRILGFRRAAPVTGRMINITELEPFCSDEFRETFFISPANNSCFYGNCTYYCDAAHAFCGNGEMIEVSLVAFLPLFDDGLEINWRSPWRRSYSKRLRTVWQKNNSYCNKVREDPLLANGRRLLDIMDMVVLDFLTGNQDRHHYETFSVFGNDSSILHIDHGRAFGRPYFDDPSVLTPIIQCCAIRDTTLQKLLEFNNGPKPLSQLMRESLAKDPIAPILLEPHLEALDRRNKILLHTIRNCIKKAEDTATFFEMNEELKRQNIIVDWMELERKRLELNG